MRPPPARVLDGENCRRADATCALPIRPSPARPCHRFQAEQCPDGDDCRYLHDAPKPSVAPPPPADQDNEYVSPQKPAERAIASPAPEKAPAKVKIIRKDKYKTALCDKFDTPAGCPYRNTCQYAHGPGELVVHSPKVAKAAPAPAPPVFDMRQKDFPEFANALAQLGASPVHHLLRRDALTSSAFAFRSRRLVAR